MRYHIRNCIIGRIDHDVITISGECINCATTLTVVVREADYNEWVGGVPIGYLFEGLSPSQKLFLTTGKCCTLE